MSLKTKQPDNIFKIIIAFAIIITLIFGVWWFGFRQEPKQAVFIEPPKIVDNPEPEPSSQVDKPPEPRTVITYNKDDEGFKELMERRKAEYGLDKGVDMIVKEDESVEIGGTTIPMQEILNKIRLKKGEVVEQDIGSVLAAKKKKESIERLFEKLEESEDRFWELEKELSTGQAKPGEPGQENQDGSAPLRGGKDGVPVQENQVQEHARLTRVMEKYQAYKKTLQDIEVHKQLIEADDIQEKVKENVKNLEDKKLALENELKKLAAARISADIPDDKTMLEELDKIEARFYELEKELDDPEIQAQNEVFQEKIRQRAGLRQIVAGYNLYKQIVKDIQDKKSLLEEDDIKDKLKTGLTDLRIKRDDLENYLKLMLLPDESLDVYGVYVVRRGDNVWNIHFGFLKEYFQNRDIGLSPSADEPVRPGVSSGVGRLLKFSENMVHIYNLKENRLSPDLNIIHPLSKIVVFNMAQVFDLLNQVDYNNIKHIRYDGENIWIPAQDS